MCCISMSVVSRNGWLAVEPHHRTDSNFGWSMEHYPLLSMLETNLLQLLRSSMLS